MFELASIYYLAGIILFSAIIWFIVGLYWSYIRNFFHKKYSLFDFSFVLIYFLEQFGLVLVSHIYPTQINFWVTVFAITVITTVSVQKLLMDSKDKKLAELHSDLFSQYNQLYDEWQKEKSENKDLKETYSELIDKIPDDSNK